jgi:hypothetical protein
MLKLAEREGLLDGFGLESKLGERTVVGARVGGGLVLLEELLGGVLDQHLVEGLATKLVVVRSSESGVHATAAGDNGHIGAGATKVGDKNDLVLASGLGLAAELLLCVVCEESRDGLGNSLDDLDASLLGHSDDSSPLGVAGVGGNGEDGAGDLATQVVAGAVLQPCDVPDSDLLDVQGALLLTLTFLHLESGGLAAVHGLRAGALVAGTGVDVLELLAEKVSEESDGVARVADELRLGLGALVLLAGDVGQDGGDLAVTLLVGDYLSLAIGAGEGDAAVGVAEGQADGGAARRLGGALCGAHCDVFVRELCWCIGYSVLVLVGNGCCCCGRLEKVRIIAALSIIVLVWLLALAKKFAGKGPRRS